MVQWEAELTELVTQRSGALVGYAYSLTRDKPQAEDLVQDALVKVYSRLRRPGLSGDRPTVLDLDSQEATNAEGYVRRAILTIYLDGYRRRNHWSGLKHLLAEDAHSPGADRVATARVDVGVALRRLSPRQREAVTLRFFEDLTVPQIAAALGTSQGTIKRHLFDATTALRDLLAEVPVPEVETSLDERLGSVTRAVRRRRTAKVGALAGVSMVLAVVLAWGALAAKPWIRSEPVPPADPSPDAAAVGAGWAPSGWRELGPQFHCGMEVTALMSSSDSVRLELTGDVRVAEGHEGQGPTLEAPLRITRTDEAGSELGGKTPRLVFAQNGQVVDIGQGWNEGGYEMPDAGGSADVVAEAGPVTACGAWTTSLSGSESYQDQRPAGTYDVYAVQAWAAYDGPDDQSGALGLAVSAPVTMEVPAVEMPDDLPVDVEVRDGYQPPWLEGTSLACGVYASDIPGGPHVPSERSGLRLGTETPGAFGEGDDVTVTFTETEGKPVDTTRTPVSVLWLSGGRVVGVGRDVWSEPEEDLHVDAQGETSVVVPVGPDRTCLEDPDAGMPEAAYELYVLTELAPGSGEERQFVSVSTYHHYSVTD
jgi:RNA polymerase sigma factor (sigma-70 family)